MSHRSSVPSGAAPVILKGRVHLFKQWMKKHTKAKMRGFSSGGWKDKKRGTFRKATGQERPSPATVWILASNNRPAIQGHPPRDHESPLERVWNTKNSTVRTCTNLSAQIKPLWWEKHLPRYSELLRVLIKFPGVSRSLKRHEIYSIQTELTHLNTSLKHVWTEKHHRWKKPKLFWPLAADGSIGS